MSDRRARSDAGRIASIREAIRAANGDWHELTNLWSICADLDWLLARAGAGPSDLGPRVRRAAENILDRPNADPDDDAAILARFVQHAAEAGPSRVPDLRAALRTHGWFVGDVVTGKWVESSDWDPVLRSALDTPREGESP